MCGDGKEAFKYADPPKSAEELLAEKIKQDRERRYSAKRKPSTSTDLLDDSFR